jgi:hypothetical protein
MVLDLVIIGLAIALVPIGLVAFSLIVGSENGTRKGLAFIVGWLACLVAVTAVTLAVTGGKPPAPDTAPSTAALAVKAFLGAVLIWVGLRTRRQMPRTRKQPKWMAQLDQLSIWTAAGLGIFLQPWTLVGAGAATIIEAGLSTAGNWLTLVVYCLLATLSYLVMELYMIIRPAAGAARMEQLQKWIDTHTDQAIVVLSIVVGCWLLGHSLYLIFA